MPIVRLFGFGMVIRTKDLYQPTVGNLRIVSVRLVEATILFGYAVVLVDGNLHAVVDRAMGDYHDYGDFCSYSILDLL
jgi:hypothetical protein